MFRFMMSRVTLLLLADVRRERSRCVAMVYCCTSASVRSRYRKSAANQLACQLAIRVVVCLFGLCIVHCICIAFSLLVWTFFKSTRRGSSASSVAWSTRRPVVPLASRRPMFVTGRRPRRHTCFMWPSSSTSWFPCPRGVYGMYHEG